MKKKYTDAQLKEMLAGHRLCGWISQDRSACDCGHYDDLTKKDPEIPALLMDYVKRDLQKEAKKNKKKGS